MVAAAVVVVVLRGQRRQAALVEVQPDRGGVRGVMNPAPRIGRDIDPEAQHSVRRDGGIGDASIEGDHIGHVDELAAATSILVAALLSLLLTALLWCCRWR